MAKETLKSLKEKIAELEHTIEANQIVIDSQSNEINATNSVVYELQKKIVDLDTQRTELVDKLMYSYDNINSIIDILYPKSDTKINDKNAYMIYTVIDKIKQDYKKKLSLWDKIKIKFGF